MPRRGLILAAAAAAWAFSGAPAAQAAKVIVVGHHAVERSDPFVPSQARSDEGRPPRAGHPRARAFSSQARRGAVERALRKELGRRRIRSSQYGRYLGDYRRARSVRNRLKGRRGGELGYVVATLEGMAASGRLTPTRMPVLFLTLERNTQYWPRMPFPGSRTDVTFRGSEILFRYFPGEGLELHPLSTFKKANLMHGACVGAQPGPCRRQGLARLLDEMKGLAVRRSPRFIAWEYLFRFGGGSPPWMSGMAQATAIQAYGRAAKLLGRPDYNDVARRALGAFETPPPVGVRSTGFRGGPHYLQYSFASRYYIFNAFTQALIGLYDFGTLTGDQRALKLFRDAEPELEREIPSSDLGDWTMYSYRSEVSDPSYHELLREVMQSMCSRRLGAIYCDLARRYARYQTEPPQLEILGPDTASSNSGASLRFTLSKLSAVEITIRNGGGRTVFHKITKFAKGTRSIGWRTRGAGTYNVQIGAKEMRTGRGLKGRTSSTVEVQ